MAGPLSKVSRGDPLSVTAAGWNAIVDAATRSKANGFDEGRGAARGFVDGSRVLVLNSTGGYVERFDVLSARGVVIGPLQNLNEFQNHPVVDGVAPTGDYRSFVILQEPLHDGAIGQAVVVGATIARVYVEDTAAANEFADAPRDGSTTALVAGATGPARIVWRQGGGGLQWAFVVLGVATSGGVFPVTLDRVGGAAGSAAAPATWTYDVAGIGGEELGTAINPVASPHAWRRPAVGIMTEATSGLAYFDADGDVVLTWINEVAQQEAC